MPSRSLFSRRNKASKEPLGGTPARSSATKGLSQSLRRRRRRTGRAQRGNDCGGPERRDSRRPSISYGRVQIHPDRPWPLVQRRANDCAHQAARTVNIDAPYPDPAEGTHERLAPRSEAPGHHRARAIARLRHRLGGLYPRRASERYVERTPSSRIHRSDRKIQPPRPPHPGMDPEN